jgi:hypothetical protein
MKEFWTGAINAKRKAAWDYSKMIKHKDKTLKTILNERN